VGLDERSHNRVVEQQVIDHVPELRQERARQRGVADELRFEHRVVAEHAAAGGQGAHRLVMAFDGPQRQPKVTWSLKSPVSQGPMTMSK
jgi:hypothetical protein